MRRAVAYAGRNRQAVLDHDRAQRRDVDHHALRRRAPREAVPAAANRHRQARRACEGERRGDVLRALAQHDGGRVDAGEARDRRPPEHVVGGCARPHHVTGDDLRMSGFAEGPGLGRVLQDLLVDVVDEPAKNTREWLLERAAQELT